MSIHTDIKVRELAGTPLNAAEVLQQLIRFDTTNPPGDERDCILHVRELLEQSGIHGRLFGRTEARPNLLARLPGRGTAPPLLLHGHVDVVSTAGQQWSVPPFAGVNKEGHIWGRGALDMKGGVSAFVTALAQLVDRGIQPAGDVILAVLSDEEAGSAEGARYMVTEHPELFAGVRYCIGEGGGLSFQVGERRVFPVMVADKTVCWLRGRVRGPGGHASMPIRGSAVARLGELIAFLDAGWLPTHVTEPARLMMDALAAGLDEPLAARFADLLDAERADAVLDTLGPLGRELGPLLHNTAAVTSIRCGEKVNVIPSEVEFEIDGRLLPGFTYDDLLAELLPGGLEGWEFEPINYDPAPQKLDMGLYPLCRQVLEELDPGALVVPAMITGFTDGAQFLKLGIQQYGFIPFQLPPGFHYQTTLHAADERIPVRALEFAVESLVKLLTRYEG